MMMRMMMKTLLVDLSLSCALHQCALPLYTSRVPAALLLWLVSVVKWFGLRCFLRSGWSDARVRCYAAVTCLMCPVTLLTGARTEPWSPGRTLVSAAAVLAACLFWEASSPAESSPRRGLAHAQKRNRVLFLRVVRYSRVDAPLLTAAFVFLTLAVTCDMFIPFYTGRVIDILGDHYQHSSFMSAISIMALLSLGSSLSSGLRGGLFMATVSRLNNRVRLRLFSALVKQEIGFFEDKKTGDLTSRLSVDTNLMSQSVALNVNVLLRSFIKSIGVLYLMVSLSWKLTLVTFIEVPLIAVTQKIYNTHYEKLSKEVQDSMARANEAAGEAVSAVRTIRSFHQERGEACRYDDCLSHTHELKTRRDSVRALYLLLRRVASLGTQALMLIYGRQLITAGHMTAGSLVTFILFQEDLGSHIRTLVYMFSNMLNSVGAAAKVFEYLDRTPLVRTDGHLQPETLRGHVSFQNLSFCYPTRPDQPALKNVSLELKAGQMTALVGVSGGGKSTCVSLLEGFYEPQQGQILLDGRPLLYYQHQYLHQKVVLVGQDPVLFSGSVRDNITYGLSECDQRSVEEAAREANAHDFISSLDRKYDTDVGERGCLLSAGQKQRIAIARALVRRPQVLVLDEVTSSLDAESERMVQEALSRKPDQTLLVVTHRLKTIKRADQIVLLEGGEVVERGTHRQLMEKKGSYYRLRERLFTDQS